MKIKPLIFNIYAGIFLAIAVSMPLQVAMLYGHSIVEINSILNKLTVFNILVMIVCLYNFYYCLKASDDVKWSFPLSIGIVCLNNSIVLIYGNDFESYSVILSTILFISVIGYFLVTNDTDVINHPENQWWRIPERKDVHEHIMTIRNEEKLDLGSTFDLSIGGAFIAQENLKDINLKTGEVIELIIGDENPVQCKAKIVRKVAARGKYPAGVGVQFIELSLVNKLKLRQKLFSNQLALAA